MAKRKIHPENEKDQRDKKHVRWGESEVIIIDQCRQNNIKNLVDAIINGDTRLISEVLNVIEKEQVKDLIEREVEGIESLYLKCLFGHINNKALEGCYNSNEFISVINKLMEIDFYKTAITFYKKRFSLQSTDNKDYDPQLLADFKKSQRIFENKMKLTQEASSNKASSEQKTESTKEKENSFSSKDSASTSLSDENEQVTEQKVPVETTSKSEESNTQLNNSASDFQNNQNYFLSFFVSKTSSQESLDKSVESPVICDNNLADLLSLPDWIQELYKHLIDFLKQSYDLSFIDIQNKGFAINFIDESSSQEIVDRYLHENPDVQNNEQLSKHNLSLAVIDTNLIYMGEMSYLYSNILQGYDSNLDLGVNQLDYQIYA